MQQPHLFRLGEHIHLIRSKTAARIAGGSYTVLRLLANDAADREYRVQSGRDGHERVVCESEMRLSAATLVATT